MIDTEESGLKKVLTALLLFQLSDLSEGDQVALLMKSGWTNAEIAQVTGLSENAIGIRRSRSKKPGNK